MTRRPEWISKDEDGKDSIALSEPDIAAQIARYGNKYPYRPKLDAAGSPIDPDDDPGAHLYQFITAQLFMDARTKQEWDLCARSYPKAAIPAGQSIQQTNPNVAARAYYLREALQKLLELVSVPQPMVDDLRAMLDRLVPRGAEDRARVQRAILDDPTASLNTIAKRTGMSAAQISKYGQVGLLFWPADPVGSDPAGST